MDIEKVIAQSEENIRQALRDYAAHTSQTDVLDDVSDKFIQRLAKDNAYAKVELRELFSQSPVYGCAGHQRHPHPRPGPDPD